MKYGIDRFIGLWQTEDGYRLEIKRKTNTAATVSLYDPSGEPVARPYFNNKPTIKMSARYDEYYGEFRIELWAKNKGFELDICYEENHQLDKLNRESLIPAITRHEEDYFLDSYMNLFGNFKHFTRII